MFTHIVAGLVAAGALGGAGAGPGYNFLVLGGGGEPGHNEIALEKNALFFQRTLERFGGDPAEISLYFANGDDGQETVRYLDANRRERFKVPEVPHLKGASTRESFQQWLGRTREEKPQRPIFLYFTGHGGLNRDDPDNNYLYLWEDRSLSVRTLSRALDRLSPETPVVAVMSQCFAGSFANFIYQGGDPLEPVAAQARCGFFATVKQRPSVGCTPEVDEADYRDYSSSFFAGLSGHNRVGEPVASADYDGDGRVSFAEAHAFAKVDARTPDWPVSTSEVWLQRQASRQEEQEVSARPILEQLTGARPEQRHVIEALARRLGLELGLSLNQSDSQLSRVMTNDEQAAYGVRLWMELIHLSTEAKVRTKGEPGKVAVLDRLLACERGSWHGRPAVSAFPAVEEEDERDPAGLAHLCGSEERGTPYRIATNAHRKGVDGGKAWTPQFRALFARAGMSLDDPTNRVYLQEHVRTHPEKYHQEIYERLQATLEGCGDEAACGEVLRMALRRLAAELCTADTPLSSLVSW
jgi:hypothetical protein